MPVLDGTMSAKATFWAWEQDLKSSQKLVLLCLANCHNDSNNRCYPSISYISNNTGLNKKTIISSLEILEKSSIIYASKMNGKSTCYEFNFSYPLESETSTKNGTGTKINTGTKNGTAPVPNSVPEPKKNLKDNLKEKIYGQHGLKIALPEWLPNDSWNDFVEDRKTRKKKLTQKAAELAINKLGKLREEGNDPVAVINQTIERAYAGLFPVNGGTTHAKSSNDTRKISELDRNAEIRRRDRQALIDAGIIEPDEHEENGGSNRQDGAIDGEFERL